MAAPTNYLFFSLLLILGCAKKEHNYERIINLDSLVRIDSLTKEKEKPKEEGRRRATIDSISQLYSNERFKDVSVVKLGDGNFQIKGKGQIFESNFGWVVEDGHRELKKGYASTDAGAPAWGNFDFTINVSESGNGVKHLILFENSAKDGARVHEHVIPLP